MIPCDLMGREREEVNKNGSCSLEKSKCVVEILSSQHIFPFDPG